MNSDGGYTIGLPPVATTYGGEIDSLMYLLHIVMVAMFIIWGVYFGYCLWTYRATPGGKATYHQAGEKTSFIPDGIILAFEVWLILAFGIPLWAELKQETPPVEDSLEIHMVAEQFAWNFQYAGPDGKFGRRDPKLVSGSNPMGIDDDDPASADDVMTVNNLYVPVNKPFILRMTSKDVIHDFQVTNFRNKQDVVPGLETMLWFEPNKEGKYEIGCAQLCGLGHTKMVGNVFVKSQAEYEEWFQEELEYKLSEAEPASSDNLVIAKSE